MLICTPYKSFTPPASLAHALKSIGVDQVELPYLHDSNTHFFFFYENRRSKIPLDYSQIHNTKTSKLKPLSRNRNKGNKWMMESSLTQSNHLSGNGRELDNHLCIKRPGFLRLQIWRKQRHHVFKCKAPRTGFSSMQRALIWAQLNVLCNFEASVKGPIL